MAIANAEARKASYERAIAQATQDVINWATNSEEWANYMKTRAHWSQADPDSMRLAFYGLVTRGMLSARHSMLHTFFTSEDYYARREDLANWHYEQVARGQRVIKSWTYSNDDSYSAAKDLAETGIWLADDGENITIKTVYDAFMLALNTADWAHVLAFFRDEWAR